MNELKAPLYEFKREQPQVKTQSSNLSPITLVALLIENNPTDDMLITAALEDVKSLTIKLLHAARLADGLARLAENKIDVVLLDINLPDCSSLASFERIHKAHPEVPVIVLTGHTDESLVSRLLLVGAQDFIPKREILTLELARTIRFAIDRQAAIVELKFRTQQLQHSEHRLNGIFDASHDAMVVVNQNGIIKLFNPAAERLFGHTAAEMLNQPLGLPIVADEATELEVQHSDGPIRIVELSAASIVWEEQPAHFLTLRDITARRNATKRNRLQIQTLESLTSDNSLEQSLEMIIHMVETEDPSAICAIYLVDDSGSRLREGIAPSLPNYFNAAMTVINIDDFLEYGDASGTSILSRVISDITTHPSCNSWYRDLAARADLRSGWFEPIIAAGGGLLGIIAIYHRKPFEPTAHDLQYMESTSSYTKLAIERELSQTDRIARQVAEASSAAKSNFLATMSHEIRTPMNGVIGLIDVLMGTRLGSSQHQMMETVKESAFSLLRVIDDVLDFSKIESGNLELDMVPISVEELIQSITSTMQSVAADNDVEIISFCDPMIPARLEADSVRLRQILLNLLGNAIKFSGRKAKQRGRVMIRADMETAGTDATGIRFRVIDNGIGMSSEVMSSILKPFTQAESSTTRMFGGTGLGLSIVSKLLEMMSSALIIDSEPDEGSTFAFNLNLPHTGETTSPAETASTLIDLSGLSTVILAQDADIAEVLEKYLSAAGAETFLTKSVDELPALLEHLIGVPEDQVIVVFDNQGDDALSNELLQFRQRHYRSNNFHCVVLDRGHRGYCRVHDDQTVGLDLNAMRRDTFLHSITVAAGRSAPERTDSLPQVSIVAVTVPTIEEAAASGQLILLADDNEINQRVILCQLQTLGYAADVVADGHEALELWQSGRYALILTDIHMPEMDGLELARRIRNEEIGTNSRIPIIAVTANVMKGEIDRCVFAGMDDYLSKPMLINILREKIERWMPASNSQTTYTEPPVDVSVLEELVGDDPEIIDELLQIFRTSSATTASELRAACHAKKAKKASEAAHKLKSSARSVGAIVLGELCEAMEQAERGDDTSITDLMVLLPSFNAELAAVDSYLEKRERGKSARILQPIQEL
ncbi:MAG: signal transduction histidine kinase/DNA-binding response OmpR family regulator [Halieaceae bacterium]|jgi:signal transduction histidine kinase/DNA-binding response OmpR family regulator